MRQNIKLPRIIKIVKVIDFKVWVMFNNGQIRFLDFERIFKQWKIKMGDLEYSLLNQREFQMVELRNQTLSWSNVEINSVDENGRAVILPYEIGADVLYNLSILSSEDEKNEFGDLIKVARVKAGMTQDELAQRTGTTRFYISRIENGKTDFEISTLRKIVEAGLGRKLKFVIE
jgi:DNA-binding XRE family transcriptional regulator